MTAKKICPEDDDLQEEKYNRAFEEINKIFSDSYKAPDMDVLELGNPCKKGIKNKIFFCKKKSVNKKLLSEELQAVAVERIDSWIKENLPSLAGEIIGKNNREGR